MNHRIRAQGRFSHHSAPSGTVANASVIAERANLARNISKVALLVESSRASGRSFLKGVAAYTHYVGQWSICWEPAGLEAAWPVLERIGVDGIIMRDGDQLPRVLGLKIPTVVLGHSRREIPGVVNVVTDSSQAGWLGAEHLVQCGFQHFAFVGIAGCSNDAACWSKIREEHFRRRLRALGFNLQSYHLPPSLEGNWIHARGGLAQWLNALPKPVGVMACNDDCGVQVIESCRITGLIVPDQVGVLGVDNDEIACGLSHPSMSSVAVNFERAGYEAAAALGDLMKGRRPVSAPITVPVTHVVARRSTDHIQVPDPRLGRALQYIRNNARRTFGVADVVSVTGMSRRVLERRFRQHFKASIHAHIRRARAEQICKMLVETNAPVSEVAYSLGFEDVQHVARYFRAVYGINPLLFRRSFGKKGTQGFSLRDGFVDNRSSIPFSRVC